MINILKDIEACIFDMDGTLVDSMWVWAAIDIEYLTRHGHPVPPEMKREIEGLSMREVAVYFKNRFNISDDIDTIISDWNNMAIEKYTNEVPIKPGLKEFLVYLKQNNIKIGLFTSNSLVLAEAGLKGCEIYEYFNTLTAGCEGIKGKPDPEGYLVTAEKLSVKPENCLVFEDLVKGILAGKNAGMKTCAVKDNYSEYQIDEKKALADYYIEDYYEIFKN